MSALKVCVRDINGKQECWLMSQDENDSESTLERLGFRLGGKYNIPLEQALDSGGSGRALYFLEALEGRDE